MYIELLCYYLISINKQNLTNLYNYNKISQVSNGALLLLFTC